MLLSGASLDTNRLVRTESPRFPEAISHRPAKELIVDSRGSFKEYYDGSPSADAAGDFAVSLSTTGAIFQSGPSLRNTSFASSWMHRLSQQVQHHRRDRRGHRQGSKLAMLTGLSARKNGELPADLLAQAPPTTPAITTAGQTSAPPTTPSPASAMSTTPPLAPIGNAGGAAAATPAAAPLAAAAPASAVPGGGNSTAPAPAQDGGGGGTAWTYITWVLVGVLVASIVVAVLMAAGWRRRHGTDRLAALRENVEAPPARASPRSRADFGKSGVSEDSEDSKDARPSRGAKQSTERARSTQSSAAAGGEFKEKRSYRDRRSIK